jgi:hypothetical protein
VVVGDAVTVTVAVALVVADGVEVAVAVRVAEAVAVAVAVDVDGSDPFADPVSLTLADEEPAVASLLIVMLPEKLLEECSGANSSVTVDDPCG